MRLWLQSGICSLITFVLSCKIMHNLHDIYKKFMVVGCVLKGLVCVQAVEASQRVAPIIACRQWIEAFNEK